MSARHRRPGSSPSSSRATTSMASMPRPRSGSTTTRHRANRFISRSTHLWATVPGTLERVLAGASALPTSTSRPRRSPTRVARAPRTRTAGSPRSAIPGSSGRARAGAQPPTIAAGTTTPAWERPIARAVRNHARPTTIATATFAMPGPAGAPALSSAVAGPAPGARASLRHRHAQETNSAEASKSVRAPRLGRARRLVPATPIAPASSACPGSAEVVWRRRIVRATSATAARRRCARRRRACFRWPAGRPA